jgi:hypothetical protein
MVQTREALASEIQLRVKFAFPPGPRKGVGVDLISSTWLTPTVPGHEP